MMSNSGDSRRISALSWGVHDPTPVLFMVAGALAWILVGSDGGPGRLIAIAVVALPAVIWLGKKVISRPEAAVILIVVAGAIPRLFIEIGGLKARPEHVSAGIFWPALPLFIKKRPFLPPWIKAGLLPARICVVHIFRLSW